jgi:hypothetical protein
MQSFLPYRSFKESAETLDSQRLNKQITEAKQIYAALTGMSEPYGKPSYPTTGWRHHPAVKMWKGYEHMLCLYALRMRQEATRRGINDNTEMESFFNVRMNRHPFIIPSWMCDEDVLFKVTHSHQCNLIRKDWKFYKPLFPYVSVRQAFTTPYWWPS